ncbi:MAG: M20/M25/M40 family metallo-hydrolase [Acidobacteriota bacterium]
MRSRSPSAGERPGGRPAAARRGGRSGRPRPRGAAARELSAAVPAALGLAAALLCAAPPGPLAGATAPEGRAPARLIAALLGPTPLERDLRYLCDRIGGRPTGSPACERAVDWFRDRFQKAGLDRSWTESFEMPRRWEEARSRAMLTRPERLSVDVVAMPYSPPTPRRGLDAPVVFVGDGSEEEFERAGTRARGALLLVGSEVIATWEDLFADYMRLPPIVKRAGEAGAAGLLLVGGRARDLLYRHIATFGDPAPFPMAIVAREEGLRLARLGDEEEVRLRLDLDVRTGPAYEARNVLAEIRGRERPEEIVLAGAHLDSWDLGTGALDDGANCALLLDVARQMAALGVRPRRTVRFVLFTGEEQGMWGSLGYVRSHADELDRHAAAVILDEGTGRITGFSLGGRADLRGPVEKGLRPVAGYGAALHTEDAFVGTDNFDFLLEGSRTWSPTRRRRTTWRTTTRPRTPTTRPISAS